MILSVELQNEYLFKKKAILMIHQSHTKINVKCGLVSMVFFFSSIYVLIIYFLI